jgi:hypothetical protein
MSAREQLFFGNETRTDRLGLFLSEILAPGDDGHAEGKPNARNLGPNVAKTEHAKRAATQAVADIPLPTA